MNEFERRFLDLAGNHRDLMEAAKATGPGAVVRYFGYSLTLGTIGTALVAGTTLTGVIPIQADSAFVVQAIACATITAGAGLGAVFLADQPQADLQITDTGSGDVLFSGAAQAMTVAGGMSRGVTGIPLVMPTARIIPPNTNVRVEMTYLGAAGPELFFLTLVGSRVEHV